jgi:YidC/Oxa1 family membrane protein insertase
LYRALELCIDLRQAPFVAWIRDLSQPDDLCALPFPILGATRLHVLPLLMGTSWFIQSLLQPKSPDPQARRQQRIFMFMPIVFTFILYSMPSGLILYWFVQTLLSIGEQYLIKRMFKRIEEARKS